MACTLSTSLDGTTACPPPSPGLDEAYCWLANRADVTFTGGTGHVYTDITAGAGDLYRWKFHRKGFDFTEEAAENDTTGAVSFAQALTGRILDLSGASAAAIDSLRGTDLVAIVKTKAGKVLVFGSTGEGLRLKANTAASAADNYGESLTLGNDESSAKYYQLLDTDLATTLAALVALEA